MADRTDAQPVFDHDHMIGIMTIAFHEKRTFSLTPLFSYEMMNGSYFDEISDSELEAIKQSEFNYICDLCGDQLFSHGSRTIDVRERFMPDVFRLRPFLECKNPMCKVIRCHFGMELMSRNTSLVEKRTGPWQWAYGATAEKRRQKAKTKHKQVIMKRFRDPQGLFDLFLSETLRQKAIECR